MNPIENLAEQADRLLEEAERMVDSSLEKAADLFREGLGVLFKAFLTMEGEDIKGNFLELYQKCQQIAPEFEEIEDDIDLINQVTIDDNPEDLVDAANEVWDFVTEYISE